MGSWDRFQRIRFPTRHEQEAWGRPDPSHQTGPPTLVQGRRPVGRDTHRDQTTGRFFHSGPFSATPAAEVPQDDGDRFRSFEGPRRTREPPRGRGPHNNDEAPYPPPASSRGLGPRPMGRPMTGRNREGFDLHRGFHPLPHFRTLRGRPAVRHAHVGYHADPRVFPDNEDIYEYFQYTFCCFSCLQWMLLCVCLLHNYEYL